MKIQGCHHSISKGGGGEYFWNNILRLNFHEINNCLKDIVNKHFFNIFNPSSLKKNVALLRSASLNDTSIWGLLKFEA